MFFLKIPPFSFAPISSKFRVTMDNPKIIELTALILLLLFLSARFSGIETALTNISVIQLARMRKRKLPNVEYVIRLKQNMNRTLIAILIGNNVVNVLLASIVALAANEFLHAIGISFAIGLLTFLIVVFGEITPKSYALGHSRRIALRDARALYYLSFALEPVISVLVAVSGLILRMRGAKTSQKNVLITDQVIRDIASFGFEEGAIKKVEKNIIEKVLVYGEKRNRDIMVPMEKVFSLKKNFLAKDIRAAIARHGFTRVPVKDKDRVVGIIHAKDLLIAKSNRTLHSLMRRTLFVPAAGTLTHTFRRMKQKRIHLAIVRDARGRHLGVITMEDVLEELVGEIQDEFAKSKYGQKKSSTA